MTLEELAAIRSRNEQRKTDLPVLDENDLKSAIADCDCLLAEVVNLRLKLAHTERMAASPHINHTRAIDHVSS